MRNDICIYVSAEDRARLERLTADRNTPCKVVWRVGIVLATAEGLGINAIMRRTGKSKPCVWRWQEHYIAAGIDGLLCDKTRPSRKKPLTAEIKLTKLDKDGQTPHEEFGRTLVSVPSLTFWLVEDCEFIGAVNIRSSINSHVLARFGGHVGYAIRPSMRRRGYGTRQLALALPICRGMGIGIVRISCAENNVASRRVIENNGGVLLRHCEPTWYCEQSYLLFEILLI